VQPPASSQALAEPIYEAFYGLKEEPFAISTDPKFFFMSGSHRRAHEELLAGLQRREALLLVSGETGTGKTTLCRAVIDALGARTFSSILHNPYMLGTEMLRLIVRDFGLVSREELRHGALAGADASRLLEVIESFLRSLVPLGSHAVVVVDEAQSLSPTLLDEMRMLTAFERDGQRLMQVVLCGQPRLLSTLKTEAMYALNERITRRVVLTPLQPDEVEAYIHHRLVVAGGDGVTFQRDAAELVAELSRGLPRRVNVLCDRALQEGRIQGQTVISPAMIKRAARSLSGGVGDEAQAAPAPGPDGEPAVVDESQGAKRSGAAAWLRGPKLAVAGGATLAVVAALSYGFYARTVLGRDPGVPASPAAPALDIGAVALPSVPSDEALKAILDGLGKASGQLPDNRHQLD
jgi:general secretion pathway protein A